VTHKKIPCVSEFAVVQWIKSSIIDSAIWWADEEEEDDDNESMRATGCRRTEKSCRKTHTIVRIPQPPAVNLY
jgi:hypothetical protein